MWDFAGLALFDSRGNVACTWGVGCAVIPALMLAFTLRLHAQKSAIKGETNCIKGRQTLTCFHEPVFILSSSFVCTSVYQFPAKSQAKIIQSAFENNMQWCTFFLWGGCWGGSEGWRWVEVVIKKECNDICFYSYKKCFHHQHNISTKRRFKMCIAYFQITL